MAITIPASWEEAGSTGSSQIIYVDTDDHTVAEPSHHIFDIVVPALVNGQWTFPSYRYRHRRTLLDADGEAIAGVQLVDYRVRWAYAASSFTAGATKLKTMITDHAARLTDVEFSADVIDRLRLPR